ncbi:MAG: DUF192 domain-containing protein [Deltaproteobacteria bacterium]|nr:DUF192 domain-containing protein [Deltaproteobacteria bacterium]
MTHRPVTFLLLLSLAACRAGAPEPAVGEPGRTLEVLGRDGRVLATVAVEVVSTPEATERGLMFRDEVPGGTGMLFVFPREEVRSFWMKNTRVPLDILFLDSRGGIVGIRRNTVPFSTDSITVGLPSRYVLEVPAGWCSAHGLHRGDRVTLPF